MREYKFRAWDKEQKKMTANFILAPTSPTWGAFPIEQPDEQLEIDLKSYEHRQGNGSGGGDYTLTDWANYYGLSNFILMQYTFLKDKNGKEDWMGDIVKVVSCSITHYREIVQAESGAYCINLPAMTATGNDLIMLVSIVHENVGNIHENPELMKESE